MSSDDVTNCQNLLRKKPQIRLRRQVIIVIHYSNEIRAVRVIRYSHHAHRGATVAYWPQCSDNNLIVAC
jgi:hypothetical protein